MGAAEADGDVEPGDPEATIDGAEPRKEPARSLPVEVLAVVRDYPELLEVERRHYVVVRELARGGMGRVLEARDLRLGRQVAIKELLPKNRDIARRFEREARITARLQHPSIIHVYEAGHWQGGEPFYAMPIVAGRSLDKLVAEKTSLAQRIALLPRVIAVADALAYAHDKNVIHRDLKPANVLVGDFGETVVIDWGLAKDLGAQGDPKESMKLNLRATGEETVSGSVVGTPAYMPPEQARGDVVDQRADVYSLGALLYKVLCGHAPYQGKNANEVITQVKAGPPTPLAEREPETPPDLLAIVSKAMARAPDDRYVTASELAKDLERFQTGQLVGAHRYTAGQLVRRWLRRHRIAVGIAVAAAATLAFVGVISVRRVVEARDRAQAQRVKLLEAHGRSELLAGNAGQALAYLVAAAHDGVVGGARGFLIAEAKRPFVAEAPPLIAGPGRAVVVVSPDGKHIATAAGGRVALWTPAGQLERVLVEKGPSALNVLAFDATGSQVAAGGSDGSVHVWRRDGSVVREIAGAHEHEVLDMAFAADGRLATVGSDGKAKVWNLATGTSQVAKCRVEDPLPGAPAEPTLLTVRFEPNGERAAAGAEDGSACVWNTATGDVTTRLRGHDKPITSIRWSPDATWIATTSEDGTARVWSSVYGKQVVTPLVHGLPVTTGEISADGAVFATGDDDGVVRLWQIPSHLPSGEDGATLPPHGVNRLQGHAGRIVAIAFSSDGELVATAGKDRIANVWETRSGQPIATFEQPEALTSIAFAGSKIVTGSDDGTARLWSSAGVASRPTMLDSSANAVAVSRDGVVAVACQDSTVQLVAPAEVPLLGHIDAVYAAAFTPDGKTLVTAGEDPAPRAWDVAAKTKTSRELKVPDSLAPFHVVVAAADGDHVAVVGGDVRVISLKTGDQMKLDTHGVKIRALAYSPDGALLVGSDRDGNVVGWNTRGQVTITAALKTAVISLAFSPDGQRLAVGGNAAAQVYAVTAGTMSATPVMTTDRAPGEVVALVFACDGACLVTGTGSGVAQVWDAAKGKLLGMRDPHAGPISGFALADHGDALWIATAGKTVSKWDVHVEKSSASDLDRFMQHVPWRLGGDDVPIRSEGDQDDQRRSDRK